MVPPVVRLEQPYLFLFYILRCHIRYDLLIYIYTTNFEVSGHVSISLSMSQNTKPGVFSGTIYLLLILAALLRSEKEGWEHGWEFGVGEGKWDLLPLLFFF